MKSGHWGWNSFTLISSICLIFTVIGSWSIWKQMKEVWQERSGCSLSLSFFLFCVFSNYVSCIYGGENQMLAFKINSAARGIFYLPLSLLLIRFKPLNTQEVRRLLLLVVSVAVIWLMPTTRLQFWMISIAGNAIFAGQQLWAIYLEGPGVVNIHWLGVLLASSTGWAVYAFIVHDKVLEITQPIFVVLVFAAFVLWLKYSWENWFEDLFELDFT